MKSENRTMYDFVSNKEKMYIFLCTLVSRTQTIVLYENVKFLYGKAKSSVYLGLALRVWIRLKF